MLRRHLARCHAHQAPRHQSLLFGANTPRAQAPICIASFDPYPDAASLRRGGGGGGGGGEAGPALRVAPEAELEVEAALRALRAGRAAPRDRVQFALRAAPKGAKYGNR
jgi:hypothetical protein